MVLEFEWMFASAGKFLLNFIDFSSSLKLQYVLVFSSLNLNCVPRLITLPSPNSWFLLVLSNVSLSKRALLLLCRQQYFMCLQKSGVTVPAVFPPLECELDVLRLTRKEFERTATPAEGSSDALLLYLALDERFRWRPTLYLGMTWKSKWKTIINLFLP